MTDVKHNEPTPDDDAPDMTRIGPVIAALLHVPVEALDLDQMATSLREFDVHQTQALALLAIISTGEQTLAQARADDGEDDEDDIYADDADEDGEVSS
jgi:hypothetical protein